MVQPDSYKLYSLIPRKRYWLVSRLQL